MNELQQQNLNSTFTHYQYQNQPQNEEGMVTSPHQIEPPTLNQTKKHNTRRNRGGTIKRGMRSSGGDIVQVEGGHIIRSTGRKDRHSKVYTSKGPRDRRVRLSAHTAIEFYDVQDRLGYDRPSKAVDWLINKAKPSIDKLAELPPWHPSTIEEEQHNSAASSDIRPEQQQQQPPQQQQHSESFGYNLQLQRQLGAFISPHVDTDPIALFPTTSATSSINFHNNNCTQNLGLSLHCFQDHPGLIHWQSQHAGANQTLPSNEQHQIQTLFASSSSTPIGLENHYNRTMTWNNEATTMVHANRLGFMLDSQPFLGQGSASAYSQSGTLQSSFSFPMNSSEHHRSQMVQHPSIFGSRFVSDGLVGFCVPERIQDVEENLDVASNGPSSASPSSIN